MKRIFEIKMNVYVPSINRMIYNMLKKNHSDPTEMSENILYINVHFRNISNVK